MTGPPAKGDDFPYWLVAIGIISLFSAGLIVTNDLYSQIFLAVTNGISITVFVTLVGFSLASALGLLLAVMALSDSLILRQISRLYVEIIRGVPILVLLFYIAFVGAPGFVWLWNFMTAPLIEADLLGEMTVRDFPRSGGRLSR